MSLPGPVVEEPDPQAQGWDGRYRGELSPIGLPLSSSSPALEASRIAKSGAGTLYGFSGFNNGATQFILVFDSVGLPADGAVPVFVLSAGAAANFSAYWGSVGRAFHQGIVLCNSSTAATKTIGTATCWFDVQYV